MTDPALQRKVSEGLRDATRKLATLDIPAEEKEPLQRKLIAVTNSAKHDLRVAFERVASLLEDLDRAAERA